VVLVHRLDLLDLVRRRGFEIALDVGMERLIVVDSQKLVGPDVEDRLGDRRITPHGVGRDQDAFHIEALHQHRIGGDLGNAAVR
jgi:hypothetical protein